MTTKITAIIPHWAIITINSRALNTFLCAAGFRIFFLLMNAKMKNCPIAYTRKNVTKTMRIETEERSPRVDIYRPIRELSMIETPTMTKPKIIGICLVKTEREVGNFICCWVLCISTEE